MMTGSFRIDTSRMPLVVVHYLGTVDEAAFDRYLKDYADLLARNERYAIILDASRSGVPSSRQRARQAEFLKLHAPAIRRLCAGGAFVINSTMVRGALTAILWLTKMPFEHTVVSSRGDAAKWCCDRLGMAVPVEFSQSA